ncbi:MAG: hypothetical protein KBS91_02905 [Firmicutes bacterium]|nr:hypothetical protein [Candidatus Caballimonas caccae]
MAYKSYTSGNSKIYGYGRPNYSTTASKAVETAKTADAKRYYLISEVAYTPYRNTLNKLIEKGVLAGKGGTGENRIIDLSEDAVRLLVMLDTAGLFD